MDKLITMIDFVLEQSRNKFMSTGLISNSDILEKILNYANFLKQPLKLEMFIPCDEYGNVLDKPFECSCVGYVEDCIGCEFTDIKYQQAKEKVLFEGFEIDIMQCGHKYAVNNKLQIVNDKYNGLYFLEIYSNKKPKEVFIKTIEDLIPYNLTLTKNAIDKHEL